VKKIMRGEKMKSQRGIAAVEFALVLPILVLLAFGIIEFSLALYDKAVITNASREGARAGILYRVPPATDTEIADVVNIYCQSRLVTFGSGGQPVSTVVRGGNAPGSELRVRVVYDYTFLVLPGFVEQLTGPIDLTAETVMRME
jgi:Flp pilus assembly protein TadG